MQLLQYILSSYHFLETRKGLILCYEIVNNEYNNGETIQIWNYAERFEITTSSSAADEEVVTSKRGIENMAFFHSFMMNKTQ